METIAQTIPLPLGGISGRRPFGGALDDRLIHADRLGAAEVAALYAPYGGAPVDLAAGKASTASSVKSSNPDRVAAKAFDSDSATRWGSEYSDRQWLQVDLGQTVQLSGVKLTWEAGYATGYEIQVSNNGTTWSTIYSTTTGDGGIDDLTGLTGSGRYVRMYGTARATSYGYSLWDMNVYGTP